MNPDINLPRIPVLDLMMTAGEPLALVRPR